MLLPPPRLNGRLNKYLSQQALLISVVWSGVMLDYQGLISRYKDTLQTRSSAQKWEQYQNFVYNAHFSAPDLEKLIQNVLN